MVFTNSEYTEIYQFISAPIIAVLNAEMLATRASADFIQQVGFQKEEGAELNDFGEVLTVSFVYQKPGTQQRLQLQIPLLSLIPIPMLQVKEAEFEFGLSLLRRRNQQTRIDPQDGAIRLPGGVDDFSATLTSESLRSTNTMNVKLKVAQSDLPAGLGRLLHLLENAIDQAPESP
ncbi:MAG: DUF2589 domain-containing protein [Bacteroidota bacterium]